MIGKGGLIRYRNGSILVDGKCHIFCNFYISQDFMISDCLSGIAVEKNAVGDAAGTGIHSLRTSGLNPGIRCFDTTLSIDTIVVISTRGIHNAVFNCNGSIIIVGIDSTIRFRYCLHSTIFKNHTLSTKYCRIVTGNFSICIFNFYSFSCIDSI